MYEYNCRVVKVIDGDTVDVDIDLGFDVWLKKQRIRLFGVDTPESRTRDLEEKKYGIRAKNFVKGRLPIGSRQVLRTKLDDSRGKFGRILGEFVIENNNHKEDTTLNQLLIITNNGVPYFGQSKGEIKAAHLDNRRILESQPTL
jgi:micrococcal nuclease|tara:strand:+ start:226 stop:657 length:432 start_codon:yes stop_codon:yes gene_type:complete